MTSRRTRERLLNRLQNQGITDEAVLETIVETPRHLFIDEALSHKAYEDTALPIGYNQTISQPYTVARMSELLLEVGTGSGYQTAVLAQLCQQVFSVERILPLQERAASVLGYLGLSNVSLFHTDGGMGLEHEAPFDAIMVTAAPSVIPESLKRQLKVGGVLVAPVGDDEQKLVRILRRSDSHFETKVIEPVKFVPLLDGLV